MKLSQMVMVSEKGPHTHKGSDGTHTPQRNYRASVIIIIIVPVFGRAEGPLVDVDSHSHKHGDDERSEVGSDATERESKVHGLRQEGVCPARHTATKVPFQHLQKLIHLYLYIAAAKKPINYSLQFHIFEGKRFLVEATRRGN